MWDFMRKRVKSIFQYLRPGVLEIKVVCWIFTLWEHRVPILEG